jgi:hypothetical protein
MVNPIKLIKTEEIAGQVQKAINSMNKTNWKTNTFGIISCLLAVAVIWAPPEYVHKLMSTQAQLATLASLLGAGLLASKDHDK